MRISDWSSDVCSSDLAWDGVDRGPLDSRPAIDDLVRARNDLQPGAISLCPPIADVLTALAACGGALLSRMSGSGATCFALFESEEIGRGSCRERVCQDG